MCVYDLLATLKDLIRKNYSIVGHVNIDGINTRTIRNYVLTRRINNKTATITTSKWKLVNTLDKVLDKDVCCRPSYQNYNVTY